MAVTVSAGWLSALFINRTQQHAQQLLWDSVPTQHLLSSKDSSAIGRGSPAWQDACDFGHACVAVDEL